MAAYKFNTDDLNNRFPVMDNRARAAAAAFAAKAQELELDQMEFIYACGLISELCYEATGQVALTEKTSAVVREHMLGE